MNAQALQPCSVLYWRDRVASACLNSKFTYGYYIRYKIGEKGQRGASVSARVQSISSTSFFF